MLKARIAVATTVCVLIFVAFMSMNSPIIFGTRPGPWNVTTTKEHYDYQASMAANGDSYHPSPIVMRSDLYGGTSAVTEIKGQKKYLLVIGVLSRTGNTCFRDALRMTLIRKAKAYNAMEVKVFFLLDKQTPELIAEQNVHGDIVFMNTIVKGWKLWLGVIFYYWLKYVMDRFPDVSMLGRMDDDVFLCTPQIFERLQKVKHDMLYYGYPTSDQMCPTKDCVDDMFIIMGKTLVSRIVQRSLCMKGKEFSNCLITTSDHSKPVEYRQWTRPYKDIVIVNERENNRMIWYYRSTSVEEMRIWRALRTWDFCQKYVLFHKATINDLYKMDIQNNNQLHLGFRKKDATSDIKFIFNCTKYV